MDTFNYTLNSRDIFKAIIASAKLWVIGGLVLIIAFGAGLTQIVKDPSTDSLIPPEHPSVVTRDHAEDLFGLRDPIVISVTTPKESGLFTPDALEVLYELHQQIEALENVRADRVQSIISESRIYGDSDTLYIEPFLETVPQSQAQADQIRDAVFESPIVVGTLVSKDGSAALIVAELIDQSLAEETYLSALEMATAQQKGDIKIQVAGQGAVSGYLSGSIDRDSRKLPAIAITIIFVIIFFAFRNLKALMAPLVVLAGTIAGAIGLMAWFGIPYFVITTALPVVLVAIAVADTVHILSSYFERLAATPNANRSEIVVDVMSDLWRPLTLTTFTTMAGFIGIGLASSMPPIAYFGWFAAAGVFFAWAYSMLVLPGILAWLKPAPSVMFKSGQSGIISTHLTSLARWAATHHFAALAMVLVIGATAAWSAANVRVERSQIENFQIDQPIRIADETLNTVFAGTSYLDIVVTSDEVDGLLDADRMTKVASLQAYAEEQPYVTETRSIADALTELHSALNPNASTVLPETGDAIAQYLLLYESTGDSADLEDEIDQDYQRALIRIYMNSHFTGDERTAVEALEAYIETQFNEPGLSAQLSGRVFVDYHWMQQLEMGHTRSILISACLVFLVAALLFRSITLGILSLAPVMAAVLGVYGIMGALDIFIEPATSMFAAISIGIGIDFAIHFTDRIQMGFKTGSKSAVDAISKRLPVATRACFLNALTLGAGFSILMISELPPIFKFGLLIAVAAAASFLGGLIVTSAVAGMAKSGFQIKGNAIGNAAVSVLLAGICFMPLNARADDISEPPAALDLLTGRDIATRVANRPDGDVLTRDITMTMTDRRDRVRIRQAQASRIQDDGYEKTLIRFSAPRRLKGTAFLTHDETSSAKDLRWLYLPASGRPKQIPASDRGDYFLGTDFTYEDIRTELSFDLKDYNFERLPGRPGDPSRLIRILAIPKSDQIAKEVGYGRIEALIDPSNWVPVFIEFNSADGRALKTISVSDVTLIDGIWTPQRIEAHHLINTHTTVFEYSDVTYGAALESKDFNPQRLSRSASR